MVFSIIILENKSSKVFSCVEILQCLLYEQYEQHQDSKVSKKDMKQTMTLLFLYNAEVRYTVQLRHLTNKTQSGSVTR